MKISVNDNFMSVLFQRAQPLQEIRVVRNRFSMMILRHNKERGNANTVAAELGQDLLDDATSFRRDVMD